MVSWISHTSRILTLDSRNWPFTCSEEMKLFMWAAQGRTNLTPLYRERIKGDIHKYISEQVILILLHRKTSAFLPLLLNVSETN